MNNDTLERKKKKKKTTHNRTPERIGPGGVLSTFILYLSLLTLDHIGSDPTAFALSCIALQSTRSLDKLLT